MKEKNLKSLPRPETKTVPKKAERKKKGKPGKSFRFSRTIIKGRRLWNQWGNILIPLRGLCIFGRGRRKRRRERGVDSKRGTKGPKPLERKVRDKTEKNANIRPKKNLKKGGENTEK